MPRPQDPARLATTSAQVTAKLAELAKSSEQLAEQLNQAQIDIATAQRAAAAATAGRRPSPRRNLAHAQQQLAVSLASQYKAASFSRTAALLASNSTDGYLQTIQTMNLLTQHQSEVATDRQQRHRRRERRGRRRPRPRWPPRCAKQAALAKRQADLDAEVASTRRCWPP